MRESASPNGFCTAAERPRSVIWADGSGVVRGCPRVHPGPAPTGCRAWETPYTIVAWTLVRSRVPEKMPVRTRSLVLLIGACLLTAAPAVQAFNYGFLRQSVLEKLTAADVEIGSRTTREALDSGEDREWANPATGARGAIRILGTVDVPEHGACRRTRLDVTAGGVSGGGTYTLCKTPSGAWNFYTPPR